MNTFAPILKPISDTWNYYTGDRILNGLTRYKRDWHTKYLQSERLHTNEEYTEAYKSMYEEPELLTLFKENWARFSIVAFAERLVVVRQAHRILRNRFEFSKSTSGSLNALRSQGLFFGALRGNLLNALHFTLVYYHPLLLAKGKLLDFLAYSAAFEAICYPLDTIKTLAYADVNRTYPSVWSMLKQNFEKRGYDMLYRGFALKLAYNAIFGLNLASICNDSNLVYLTTPLWLSSYALLTLKVRSQVADTTLSLVRGEDATQLLKNALKKEGFRGLYAGIIPFALLNIAFAYTFPSLFSDQKKSGILDEIISRGPGDVRDKNWASI